MITPANERIALAIEDLIGIATAMSHLRLELQKQSNPLWTDLASLEGAVDNAMDMLENGY